MFMSARLVCVALGCVVVVMFLVGRDSAVGRISTRGGTTLVACKRPGQHQIRSLRGTVVGRVISPRVRDARKRRADSDSRG